MATTREEAMTSITSLEDKKSNTAAKVRDALTKVLEYTETEPQQKAVQTLNAFHFWNNGKDVYESTDKQNSLRYSFKGIEGSCTTLTFLLNFKTRGNDNRYSFDLKLSDEEFKTLSSNIGFNSLDYVVYGQLTQGTQISTKIFPITIYLDEKRFLNFVFGKVNNEDISFTTLTVWTSVSFHNPF